MAITGVSEQQGRDVAAYLYGVVVISWRKWRPRIAESLTQRCRSCKAQDHALVRA
jgi:hypothetical protein